MNIARCAAVILVLGFAGACSEGPLDARDQGSAQSALSFPSGNNDGYCASNPSPLCAHGTPVLSKQLVFTFDDGPGSQTGALSSWLRGQGIRATFFVNGRNVGASALLSQLLADGHLVGNHTQNHADLATLSPDSAIVRELADTDAIIAPYVASSHFVFRAPYGSWTAHDYDVLHASAMNKYVGPVKWDIDGADWDCWQNLNGAGVMTTKQCGDRYLQLASQVGRGIVLMHDADFGDVANHDLTHGQGNTIDMVKYLVPLLKQQGYSFVRLDEVPDIAAAFSGVIVDAGSDSGSDASSCASAFNPTWTQGSGANEWWIELAISGAVSSASLEIVGVRTVPLALQWGKWVGAAPARIPTGTTVVAHARNAAGQSAQTQPFAYLVTRNPTTACVTDAGALDGGAPPDASDGGAPVDANDGATRVDASDASDASDAASDAGSCSSAFNPTWSQGSGANEWWIEYAIASNRTVTKAELRIVGGATTPLSLQWGKWVGPTSARIPTGTQVVVAAEDSLGERAQTRPFGYLTVTSPVTLPCSN